MLNDVAYAQFIDFTIPEWYIIELKTEQEI